MLVQNNKFHSIERFILVRKRLTNTINKIDDALWPKEFLIGKSQLNLYKYFSRLAQHDNHHFDQIRRLFK